MSRQALLVPVIVAALAVAAPVSATPASPAPPAPTAATAAPAAVATVIGSTAGVPADCAEQMAVAPSTIHSGGPSYTVPHDGVITSVTHQANSVAGGHIRVLVLAGTPAVSVPTTIAGRSPSLAVVPNTLNTFAVRIPVLAGQVLGIHVDVTGLACGVIGVAGDEVSYQEPFAADTASAYTPADTDAPYLVNLAATVEPDTDVDGFGDVTQDGCPLGAGTQDAATCKRPNTKITKAPAAVSASRIVAIAFKSTVRRSTFQCQVDDKPYKTCSSAFTKRFSLGKHTVRIRATSRVGVPEKKPAKVTFRITKPDR
ncbi:hypothetical protein [Nocardioides sp.]|uniref:hypothetical protein n=1 Tax=Nocardioides sp. TaxID=35761 RepID=UPI001A1ECFE7|nr:hypothetical protein [Nocardioides sp.]MBJ7358667.1 hypothetical protein [Nocardioides sp.]